MYLDEARFSIVGSEQEQSWQWVATQIASLPTFTGDIHELAESFLPPTILGEFAQSEALKRVAEWVNAAIVLAKVAIEDSNSPQIDVYISYYKLLAESANGHLNLCFGLVNNEKGVDIGNTFLAVAKMSPDALVLIGSTVEELFEFTLEEIAIHKEVRQDDLDWLHESWSAPEVLRDIYDQQWYAKVNKWKTMHRERVRQRFDELR